MHMKKIGVMGGTFNPIHIGHMMLAEAARDEFSLDEIWLIPTGFSYMKNPRDVLSAEERYRMTCLAVKDNDKMRCLDMEIRRQGRTYSYETMEELKDSFPETEFFFLVGADCLFAMESWKFPERLFRACSIIAAVREGTDMPKMERKRLELEQRYGAIIFLFSFRNLEISSTDIRERIYGGKSIRYLVPDIVMRYIEKNGLYKY
mgnify:CR=1 FL=1